MDLLHFICVNALFAAFIVQLLFSFLLLSLAVLGSRHYCSISLVGHYWVRASFFQDKHIETIASWG
jgi:hypothetical protein